MKKLYKDSSNKMIFGVCSGIARYFDIDPTIIRILWVCAFLFLSFGFWAYILCAIIIPSDPVSDNSEQYWQQQQNQYNQNYSDPNSQNSNGTYYYDPNINDESK